jgi:hypothetical protein
VLGLVSLGGGASEETALAEVVVQALQALVPAYSTLFKKIKIEFINKIGLNRKRYWKL